MNKREKLFWKWLDSHVGSRWHAQRHEDRYSVGIPDVSFGCAGTGGWIELKSLEKWPSRGLFCLEKVQANWLYERGKVSKNCWVLAEIGPDVVLWKWDRVFQILEAEGKESLIFLSDMRCEKSKFNVINFLREITNDR